MSRLWWGTKCAGPALRCPHEMGEPLPTQRQLWCYHFHALLECLLWAALLTSLGGSVLISPQDPQNNTLRSLSWAWGSGVVGMKLQFDFLALPTGARPSTQKNFHLHGSPREWTGDSLREMRSPGQGVWWNVVH